ncbi:cysteine desulfurase family protein [Cystobacter fuscus]
MLYWDYNASAPLRPEVADFLANRLRHTPAANPSSAHRAGREARARLYTARLRVATRLGCEPRELCFTASGSEGAALAIKGAFLGREDVSRTGVVLSRLEHRAVRSAAAQLQAHGARVREVAPGSDGRVRAEEVLAALGSNVAVCSLMWANNETGVLQPVVEVARACRERGILFHTDAVQAMGKVPVSPHKVDVDLLSFSAHKFGGPPGVGVLFVRHGVTLQPLVPGTQEGAFVAAPKICRTSRRWRWRLSLPARNWRWVRPGLRLCATASSARCSNRSPASG